MNPSQKTITIHSISRSYPNKTNVIHTPIKIKNLFDQTKNVDSFGLWDTGATNSCITKQYATQLGLSPIGRTNVAGVFGVNTVPIYYVNVTLNNQSITVNVPVTECEELSADSNVGMLIGMDIIGLGDFTISNHNEQTTMSFRTPSVAKTDYVELHKSQTPRVNSSKIRPNDPCHCGSGKKIKNCCGRNR